MTFLQHFVSHTADTVLSVLTGQKSVVEKKSLFTFQVRVFNDGIALLAQEGRDMWHSSFVKMPCSPASSITKPGIVVCVRPFIFTLNTGYCYSSKSQQEITNLNL